MPGQEAIIALLHLLLLFRQLPSRKNNIHCHQQDLIGHPFPIAYIYNNNNNNKFYRQ